MHAAFFFNPNIAGHHNLYFIDALIDYLETSSFCFAFVRIRRNRLEAALSLSYERPDEPWAEIGICEGLITRYCPFDGHMSLLGPVNSEVWEQLSTFQRALWIMDETEAKWNEITTLHPTMNYIEVTWGKLWPGSMDEAARQVGRLIGVNETVPWQREWEHMIEHEHAGEASQAADFAALSQEDRTYRELMNFSFGP